MEAAGQAELAADGARRRRTSHYRLGHFCLGCSSRYYHVAGSQVFGVGLSLAAYALGIRHAFDADHIVAIDNTTRKLIEKWKLAAARCWLVVCTGTLLLLIGGNQALQGLQNIIIGTALPFTIVLLLMMITFWKGLRADR